MVVERWRSSTSSGRSARSANGRERRFVSTSDSLKAKTSRSCWKRRTARSSALLDWRAVQPEQSQVRTRSRQTPALYTMMRLAHCCYFLVVASAGVMLSKADGARAASTDWIGNNHAAVRLITASDNPGNASTLDAGLEFRFAKGWHGYWRTPGDAGIPPTVDWSASENISGGEISWPAPHRLVIDDLQNSV